MFKNKGNKSELTKNFFLKLGRNIIMVAVLMSTVMGTVWVYAAFTEPAVGPASSDQDFTLNILGSNDSNNDFDSSSVVANIDGSIIERVEYIIEYLGG